MVPRHLQASIPRFVVHAPELDLSVSERLHKGDSWLYIRIWAIVGYVGD